MVIAGGLVALWFTVAFGLSFSGWFERYSAGTLFSIGTVLSASGFAILHTLSGTFRGFLRGRNLKRLTLGQALRFYGILALIKTDQNVLPALFAVPTALMDIAIAASAFLVAFRLVAPKGQVKPGFIAWHIMGVIALGVSVVLAMLTSSETLGFVSDGVTTQAMSRFPMSLVPTFVGPLVLILHLLVLAAVLPEQTELGFQSATLPKSGT